MKNHSKFMLIMLVIISMGLGLIPVASQPMALSEGLDDIESFQKAFEKVVNEAQNAFQDIITAETFEIFDVEYSGIMIDFPDAIRAGYRQYQYSYPDFEGGNYTVNVHQIHILYDYQEEAAEVDAALSIFNRQKEALKDCRTKHIGGEWQIEDEDRTAPGGDGRYLTFTMKSEDEDDLKAELNCRYTSASTSVFFDITKEIED